MDKTIKQILGSCRIEGNSIFLPDQQFDRVTYTALNKQLTAIGGKWNRKVKAHVFPSDPTDLLDSLLNGTHKDAKKELQMFFTPISVIREYIIPIIHSYGIKNKGFRILEPSAGSGNIIKELFFAWPDIHQIDACEIFEPNRMLLEQIEGVLIIGDDFLKLEGFENYYDLIIANPPFAKNQDIDHVYKMYECLKPKGQLITLTSKHWKVSSNKKEKAFVEWLESLDDQSAYNIPPGAFNESGTNIETKLLVITKSGVSLSFKDFAKFS